MASSAGGHSGVQLATTHHPSTHKNQPDANDQAQPLKEVADKAGAKSDDCTHDTKQDYEPRSHRQPD